MFNAYEASNEVAHTYRYDLSDAEMKAAVDNFLESRSEKVAAGKYLCLKVDNDEAALSDAVRTFECQIFKDAFDNGPAEMQELYGQYENASHFYTVLYGGEKGPEMVGAIRAVAESEAGFMTLTTLPDDALNQGVKNDPTELRHLNGIGDTSQIWDIGTAAITKDHRKTVAGLMLYRALYKDARDSGVEYMLAILDSGIFRKLHSFGIPFKSLSGTKEEFEYYGSPASKAVYGRVPDFHRNVIGRGMAKRGLVGMYGSAVLAYGWGVDKKTRL